MTGSLKKATPYFEERTFLTVDGAYSPGIHTLTRLEDNSLLISAPTKEGEIMCFSSDEGATWGSTVKAPKGLNIIEASNGDLVNVYYEVRKTFEDMRILRIMSKDRGKTWSETLQLETGHLYNDFERQLTRLSDGTLVIPFSWERKIEKGDKIPTDESEQDYVVSILKSKDNGVTWVKGGDVPHFEYDPARVYHKVVPHRSPAGFDEPTLVEKSNGDLYMLMRTGLGYLYESTSKDGGKTWSEPMATCLVSPSAPAVLHRLSFEPNRVVVVWNNTPPKKNMYGRDRYPLNAAISYDDCETWTYSKAITLTYGHQACYPLLTSSVNGMIIACWAESIQIWGKDKTYWGAKMARFNEEWLKTGTKESLIP